MVASIFWICSWPVVSSRSALMASIRFIDFELRLRPFVGDLIDQRGYAAWYFAPVRMRLRLSLAVWPDGLLLFAHDQDTDVFQVLEHLSDGGEPPQAIL